MAKDDLILMAEQGRMIELLLLLAAAISVIKFPTEGYKTR